MEHITSFYPPMASLVAVPGLLKGSFIFLSDLVREIRRPLQVDFLVASSYGDDMVSSGAVRLLYDPETTLEGKRHYSSGRGHHRQRADAQTACRAVVGTEPAIVQRFVPCCTST